MLTIALPKGRIANESLNIFTTIFGNGFEFEDRKLILKTPQFNFLLVRNQDVPAYVKHQAADLGIVGLDVLEEQELDLVQLLDLGIGKCKVCVGMKNGEFLDYDKPEIRVATKMERIAKNYFSKKAMAANIIKLYGSIELAPLVGLCDAIVDIVESGATMRQNGLHVVETIMESSAYLIANQNSFIEKKSEILDLYYRIAPLVKKD
ncbi:MAG: ATP phosphoribosyltransferase [Sulfurospirillaceae bacterium]|jgi:ATP phosphoribosyltransferase|nr:ATP phosphoribosyltransferase [Sulfurospirillaceae bacterium]MCK9545355.1 ATP phosphoribosyltransferase [Sulfurospirillaceae bacterium]MDY0238841.1 ATP phosphoribosyltransferase [Campylobacterales bacterium]NLM99980.1 ATP phosphoribosyltransferase [Campylobacteraceae bacterium]